MLRPARRISPFPEVGVCSIASVRFGHARGKHSPQDIIVIPIARTVFMVCSLDSDKQLTVVA
jgi:hypothetical protein